MLCFVCRFTEWDLGRMFFLKRVDGWPNSYFVEYVKPCSTLEEGFTYPTTHEVHFLGNLAFADGHVPKEPPILHLAYTSNVDFRQGKPRILFTKSHESSNPYTAVIHSSFLADSIEVFSDGSLPLFSPGSSRRLRESSWAQVQQHLSLSDRGISFHIN